MKEYITDYARGLMEGYDDGWDDALLSLEQMIVAAQIVNDKAEYENVMKMIEELK